MVVVVEVVVVDEVTTVGALLMLAFTGTGVLKNDDGTSSTGMKSSV